MLINSFFQRTLAFAAVLCLLFPQAVFSESSLQLGEAELSVLQDRGTWSLTVKAEGLKVDKVFELADPPRLVIDLLSPDFTKNRSLRLPSECPLSAVRTGRHPGRSRIVLDGRDGILPPYRWSQEGPLLTMQIGRTEEAMKGVVVLSALRKSNTDSAVRSVLVKRKPKQEPAGTAKPQSSAPAARESSVEPQNEDIALQLDGISFSYLDPGRRPAVRFRLTRRSKFSLLKKSERQYLLQIPRCAIRWSHLELPYFPPGDFKGFTMIVSEMQGSTLRISIGVDRGTALTALPAGNEIIVKEAGGENL